MHARHALQKKKCGKKYNWHLQLNVTPVIESWTPWITSVRLRFLHYRRSLKICRLIMYLSFNLVKSILLWVPSIMCSTIYGFKVSVVDWFVCCLRRFYFPVVVVMKFCKKNCYNDLFERFYPGFVNSMDIIYACGQWKVWRSMTPQMKNRCGKVHFLVSLAGFDILPVANHRFLVALHVFSN